MAIPVSRRCPPGFAAVGFALSLLGCSAGGMCVEDEPTVERQFPGVTAAPELRLACEQASAEWGLATGIYPACDAGRPLRLETPPEGFSGWTYQDRVAIAPGFSEAFLAPLVAHELGHVMFGGGHPLNCSLMCADSLGPINQGDLDWVSERL